MKRVAFLLLLVMLTFSLYSQTPEWTRLNPFPQSEEMIDITRIPGTNRLIASGHGSTIMISDDIGETWQSLCFTAGLPGTFISHEFYFINETTGFLTGQHKTILKTTDAGLTWELKYGYDISTNIFMDQIEFINDSVGCAVGGGGIILRTVDQGETWYTVASGVNNNLNNIEFLNDTTGFITYSSYEILKTQDGGISWSLEPLPEGLPPSAPVNDLYFIDDSVGFVVISGYQQPYEIFKSTDGGLTWFQVLEGVPGYYNGTFSFNDPQHGIVRFHGYDEEERLLITADGGNSWNIVEQAEEIGICAIDLAYYNETTLFTTGFNGCMFKSIDGGYTWEQINHNALNGYVNDAIAFDENNGIILESDPNESASIIRTTDGFKTFDTLLTFPQYHAFINFPDIDTGYCVTIAYPDLLIYRTMNGGEDWQTDIIDQEIPPPGIQEVDFYDGSTGIILQEDRIRLTKNAGNTWEEKIVQDSSFFFSVDYASKDKIVIAGIYKDSTALFKSFDSGDTWETDTIPSLAAPGIIEFINETYGFMLIGSQVFKSVDGGDSWTQSVINGNGFYDLRDIAFPSADTGYIVGWGMYDNVLKSTDAGETWYTINAPVTSAFNEVEFINSGTGYIFNLNDIFKTTTGGIVSAKSPESSNTFSIFNVYPNPFRSEVRIDINDQNSTTPYEMVIVNSTGKQVYATRIMPQTSGVLFYGTMLKPGVYFFQFRTEDTVIETKKMIKM